MIRPSSATKQVSNTPYLKVVPNSDEPEKQPKSGRYALLFLLIIGIAGGYYLISGSKKSPIVIDKEGNATLAPHRQKKLDKELEEIDNAEQYVLIATKDGYFPCYTCPDGSGTIYLYVGEVWRYGVTRKGERGRYPSRNYGASNVEYIPQFEGTYGNCLKMEKIQIYKYPLLAEARKRANLLAIPPGNKIDN